MLRKPAARRALTAAIVLSIAFPAIGADRSLEFSVKSAFLYRFASFVEWPPGAMGGDTSPFLLCVVGPDPYGGRISEAARRERVGRRGVVLRQLAQVDAGSRCHAAFITGTDRQSVEEALRALAGTPTLTITDSSISDSAGMIHFVIAGDRVSFDIDRSAAERSRLTISSKLLALAREVRTAQRGMGR